MSLDQTKQIRIIHLSDVHFGKHHFFNPPRDASGHKVSPGSYPTLATTLLADWSHLEDNRDTILCVTGDFAETASAAEFLEAKMFLDELISSKLLRRSATRLFVCPGNHDVIFDEDNQNLKWQPWHSFFQSVFGVHFGFESAMQYVDLKDCYEEYGCLVLSINTSIKIKKDTPDQDRGTVDYEQLDKIEDLLEKCRRDNGDKFQQSLRIAIMHHHPILIPTLAEPGKGYEAVHNSGMLLKRLKRFGFHIVMHGHKHNPHAFTDDIQTAYEEKGDRPIYIACGGTAGSNQLPKHPRSSICYNIIDLKWYAPTEQTRVRIETRSLVTYLDDGSLMLPSRWHWKTSWRDDRRFLVGEEAPVPKQSGLERRNFVEQNAESADSDTEAEKQRVAEYIRLRGNLAVCEVMPSLEPDQVYEVRLWIVQHSSGDSATNNERPSKVIWRAGRRFEIVTVYKEEDPCFCATQHYYGSMLVQAQMHFSDGYVVSAYVYARIPQRLT